MIINAEDLILGRVATFAAKKALLGETVEIVNSEKAIITGSKANVLGKYRHKIERGTPRKGPFMQRNPDKFFKRIIRGMLPYKQAKGREAFKRIKCYINIPEKFKNSKLETIKEANVNKVKNLKYIKVEQLCNLLK